MPVTHTNRKGLSYVLCKGATKTGKPRHIFARQPKGEPVDSMPEGYHIEESVNGVISLVKERPQLIVPEEMAAVETARKRHPQADNYRVAVKHNQIVIYERLGPDIDELNAMFGRIGRSGRQALEILSRAARFTPIMRFALHDPTRREYIAARWSFLGSIDDWIDVGHSGSINSLARILIPCWGPTDSLSSTEIADVPLQSQTTDLRRNHRRLPAICNGASAGRGP